MATRVEAGNLSFAKENSRDTTICPLCHSGDTAVFSKAKAIFTCRACDNSFRASPDAKHDYSRKIPMPDYFASKLRSRHHYEFIEKNIGFRNIRRVLEIGSGDGALVRHIRSRQKDIDISVIEPGSEFCGALEKIGGVKVINDYIENVEVTEKFDLVIMSHVLEHIGNPVETLRFVVDVLVREGGFLYLDVPNRDYELRSVDSAMVAPEIHLFFFDALGLVRILVDLGFGKEAVKGTKYSSLPAGFVKRMEKIGSMKGSRAFSPRVLLYKALNRLSLRAFNMFNTVCGIKPKEMGFDKSDYRYNNIALLASK
jgi:SAM-dependent methyltransferase